MEIKKVIDLHYLIHHSSNGIIITDILDRYSIDLSSTHQSFTIIINSINGNYICGRVKNCT